MINLRFHIVSLVAVFLALALGIFVGSTLLDRATVDYLKASRERVDERNRRLRAENDALRAEAEAAEQREAAFGADALGQLTVPGLEGRQVLVVATRGLDEDVVAAVATSVATAGARSAGVLWLDERTDLADDDRAASVAAAWGLDDAEAARDGWISTVTGDLADVAAADDGTAPTTTVAPDATVTTTVAPDPTTSAATVLQRLVDTDLADWEDPSGTDDGPALDAGALDVIVLVGEGAVVKPATVVVPLVRDLADDDVHVAVGEVRRPRTQRQLAEATDEPARGTFVEPFRADDVLRDTVVTVDDVDEPLGRLSLLLAVGQFDRVGAGRYGEADSADRLFPDPGA